MSMLEGRWAPALRERMGQFFAEQVRDRINSAVDMSRAPYKFAIDALNLLYLDAPTTSTPDGEDLAPLVDGTLWPLRSQAHRIVLGLGEALIRYDVDERPNGQRKLVQRIVYPHRCEVITDPRDQFRILYLREVMEIPTRDGGHRLYRETHDVRPESAVRYAVEEWVETEGVGAQWADVTLEQTRGLEGGVPYRDSAGAQVLPYAILHLTLGSHTWQWRVWQELREAQLHAGCLQTWLLAGCRDNAYPTRVAIDLDMPSGSMVPDGSVAGRQGGGAYVMIEPSTILRMRTSSTSNSPGNVTTLDATMDVGEMATVIAGYVEQALQDAGLGPPDEAPAKGVSGNAITISRDALRRSQRQQIPAARLGDQVLLALGATLANRYLGTSLPEEPEAYSITYHGIPLSTAEITTAVDRVTKLVDAGLMSKAMALVEVYPNLSPAGAQQLADELDADEPTAEVDLPDEPTAEVDAAEPMDAADDADEADAAAPVDPTAAAAVASGASVADTALNGAQVTALVEMLAQISGGTLAPEAAVLVLVAAYPTIDEATARRIVAAQSAVVVPAPPAPAPAGV
jgi:hypothetical protein